MRARERNLNAGTRLGRSTTPSRELDKTIARVFVVRSGKIMSADMGMNKSDQRSIDTGRTKGGEGGEGGILESS